MTASNPMIFERARDSQVLAVMLLCLVCASMSGCLIPQDEQVIPALPPKKNSPLRIVGQEPAPRSTFYTSVSCRDPSKVFKVLVEDEDLADTVRSQWFIDFVDDSANPQPYQTSPKASGGAKQRSIESPTAPTFYNALSNLSSGTHLLTVYVADSDFDEVVNGVIKVTRPKITFEGQTYPDDGYFDSYTWVLDVRSCP